MPSFLIDRSRWWSSGTLAQQNLIDSSGKEDVFSACGTGTQAKGRESEGREEKLAGCRR
jgi:hypothetical protein